MRRLTTKTRRTQRTQRLFATEAQRHRGTEENLGFSLGVLSKLVVLGGKAFVLFSCGLFCKSPVITHMTARRSQRPVSQRRHHEVLVRAARLHIIAAESLWQRRHKAKARIIAAMPDQKQQAIASRAHSFQSPPRPAPSRCLAACQRRRHRDRPQRRESTHLRTIVNARPGCRRLAQPARHPAAPHEKAAERLHRADGRAGGLLRRAQMPHGPGHAAAGYRPALRGGCADWAAVAAQLRRV